MSQLALPLRAPPSRFGAFIADVSNEAALTWLACPGEWPQGRLALWGEAGRGKTHLLTRWAEREGAVPWRGGALPEAPAITVDDLDRGFDEAGLLHLLNAAHEDGRLVLLASRAAPARLEVTLPDLESRLRALTAVEITAPEDTLLRGLLAKLFADRQVAVDANVQDWLLLRLPRTAAALAEAVARLDRAAFDLRAPISRTLAADVIADLL